MTTYTWPSTIVPSSNALTWLDNSARFTGPLSGVTRTVNRPGGRWRLTMTFNYDRVADRQALEAFLWRLDGATHRVTIPDFAYRRQATATGTITVDGAGQTGRTLATQGWPTDELVARAGDRVTVNGQMIPVAVDCYSSGGPDEYLLTEDGNQLLDESSQPLLIETGGALLILTHALRSSPADGSAVIYDIPVATYMLAERFDVSSMPGVFKSLMVEFEEALT